MRFVMILTSVFFAAGLESAEGAGVSNESRERIEKDRPEIVVITAIEGDDSAITIRGESGNVYAIANFAESIKADSRFTVPEVLFIREKPDSSPKLYQYEFRFSISSN